MKKILSILSFAALSFAAITSCTKEAEAPVEEPGINITIIGGDKDLTQDESKTKTYVSEEGDYVHINWQETDDLKVFEVVDGNVEHAATSSTASVSTDKKTAVFQTKITGSVEGEHSSYIYTAVYPSGCVSLEKGQYRVNIPRAQTLNGNNFASDADVLISGPFDNGGSRISNNSEISYNFTRIGTTVKMTLKGITADEKLKKVEIESPAKISGYTNINPATGETIEGGTTYYDLSLILDNYEVTGDTPVWFRVLSGTWNIDATHPLTIKAYTDKASYSKTINTTKELLFVEGGLTTFGVGLTDRIPNPVIADGEYVIVSKYSDKYYALSSIAKGERLDRADITEGFSTEEYTGTNYDIVWNLTTTSSGTAITTLNGEYLKNASSGASVGTTASYFQIAETTVDSQKYYNISTGSNYLMHNASNGWYAFYSSGVTATMIRNLYLIPANVDKMPKIILDQSSVSLPCNTDSYDITFTKRFLTGDVTAEIGSDENNIINNLSVDGNKVVVTLVPNTEALNKTATINICSEADDIAKPFTLTLEKYVATTTDVITAATAGYTNTSYTSWSGKTSSNCTGITSSATWAGKTSYNSSKNKCIQLNDTKGNAIWTTSSGGVVSQVSIDFADANGRTIYAIGSHEAFSSTSSVSTTENVIATFTSTGTFTATDEYEYVYFKVTGGATYVNSFTITWRPNATVTDIAVKTAPTTTEYHVGDKFDPTGLVITATYDDASTKDITYAGNESKFTFNPALDVALTEGNTSVIISYNGKETTQAINVYTWTFDSLVKDSAPTKTTYWEGETFNATGMTAHAHYVDNKPETPNTRDDAPSANGLTYSTDALTAGISSITVSKTIGDVTKSFTQDITVNARPEFTVSPSANATNPIAVGEGDYDDEPITVTADASVEWTVTKVSGSDDIVFTDNGKGTGTVEVMIDANKGLARDFVLRVASTTDGVSPESYDVYLHQDAASVITAVDLAAPTGLTYNNTTKQLTWNAVTTDELGNALVDYTPTYEVSIDGGAYNATTTVSYHDVSSLSAGTHSASIRAVGNNSTYLTSDSFELASFTIVNKVKKTATLAISATFTSNGNLTDDKGNIWAISSDGSYTGSKTYIQVGTNKSAVTYLKLSTSAYKDIEKVQVWGTSKANTNVTPKINIDGEQVAVAGSAYSSQNASDGGTEFSKEFNPRETVETSLEIEISRASSATGAIYFNKLIVTYWE